MAITRTLEVVICDVPSCGEWAEGNPKVINNDWGWIKIFINNKSYDICNKHENTINTIKYLLVQT